MENKHKFSLIYVLLTIWLVFVFHNIIEGWLKVEHLPYSKFMEAMETD